MDAPGAVQTDMNPPAKLKGPSTSSFSLLTIACTLLVVISGVALYLSINDKVITISQTPFVQQADGTYTMRPGEIICEGTCPPLAQRLPGVNFYKKTGAISLGNVVIKPTVDGNAILQYGNTTVRFRDGAMLIGDTDIQKVQAGRIYLTGMQPTSQDPYNFAAVLSTFALVGGDGRAINVERIKERAGSLGRSGWRLRTSQVAFSFFATPTPQIVVNNPSSRYITSNVASSVVTEDSEHVLAAYPCVQGPFRDQFSRISITVHESPSTCFNSILGRQTETVLKLVHGYTCVPVLSVSDILSNGASLTTYPDLCFLASACDSATTTVPAKQRMANDGNVTTTTQTIPLGCTTADNGIQYSVKCTRGSL